MISFQQKMILKELSKKDDVPTSKLQFITKYPSGLSRSLSRLKKKDFVYSKIEYKKFKKFGWYQKLWNITEKGKNWLDDYSKAKTQKTA